jgi:hypothetical protein
VQNFMGKEVGQGGQGVDIVGHPRRGGRRPRSDQRSATVGRPGRQPPVGCRPTDRCLRYRQAATVEVAASAYFLTSLVTNFVTKSKPPFLNFCKLLLVNLYNS